MLIDVLTCPELLIHAGGDVPQNLQMRTFLWTRRGPSVALRLRTPQSGGMTKLCVLCGIREQVGHFCVVSSVEGEKQQL